MQLRRALLGGLVIPAHPLALTRGRRLDERHQRALTRYYCAAGAGGVAVGVHTTQFAIHRASTGLLAPVLQLASETARERGGKRPVLIAGVIGSTRQAVREAMLARQLGYDAVLLSLGALRRHADRELLAHARAVAEVLPLIGFYLQPAVGGRPLSYRFWRMFAEIDAVVAIKVAPFDRYATGDVVRAVADAGRASEIALYTGNDDQIVVDLVTRFTLDGGTSVRMRGGLLGQWAVWTRAAVALHRRCQRAQAAGCVASSLLTIGAQLTDANGALFDVAHNFRGSIAGIHEVLRRQGLLAGRWCLDRAEDLSPGQAAEIDRVLAAYPHLTDDTFVASHRDAWLR
ncbi:MAG TPA: dihydrodipicolinate synthase family protein [Gemmatimonadales bacterium]|jgi:dihydrodipicolinate synthase/N-acetylneuraminate lyase